MPHQSGHVIVSALKAPVSSKGSKLKLYHLVLAACAVCFALGFIAA